MSVLCLRADRIVIFLLAAMLVVALVPVAAAHSSGNTADGKIRVTWGMLDEPATTDSKNRLDLVVRWAENSTGISGVAAMDLHVELAYGDEELPITLVAQRGREEEGRYTSSTPILLTQPGVYTLNVKGVINGTEVDVSIAGHEIGKLDEFAFPPRESESAPDTSALEARIAELEARIVALEAKAKAQSTTPAGLTQQTGAPESGANEAPAWTLLAALGAIAIAALLHRRT